MIILGINDIHDASACIIKDGKLVVAMSEERPQRIKSVGGFPGNAIEACLSTAGIKKESIDHIAVASENVVPTNMYNLLASTTVSDR